MVASQRLDVEGDLVTPDEADVAAWTVAPGVKVGGARAIALALAVAFGNRVPVFAWSVPGMPWVLDRLYELVARLRHRLPGVEPWCVGHPDDCRPRQSAA